MGLFQRPSSQRAQPLSERRHLHNFVNNNDHHDSSSKKPPTGTKRRGILGGLIRGRKEGSSSRQGPQPPTPPQPMMQARSPNQIQSVPLPSPIQQELRQKLHEAQQVEAFLSQTGNHKPTIGSSDIEFLFNHIATPTAAGNSASTQSQIDEFARHRAGSVMGRVDAILGSNNSVTTSQSVQAAYGFVDPQRSQMQQQILQQQQTQNNAITPGSVQSHHEEPLNAPTRPQHITSNPQAISTVQGSDTVTKQSKKGKKKKKGKRGLFSKKEKEWGAFESEETYYQAMQALEEGKQFQNVSNAFTQHFNNNQDNKSQSSNNTEKTSKKKKKLGAFGIRKSSQKENNDDGTIYTSEKSMASTYQSSLASSNYDKQAEESTQQQKTQPPLKGILRTNGKFSGSVSVKSGSAPTAEHGDNADTAEGKGNGDEKTEAGGYDIYKSTSSEEMFVGIRPSDDSESTGLYTDENELIELRSALASNSGSIEDSCDNESDHNDNGDNMRTSQPHNRQEEHQVLTEDGSSDYQHAFSSLSPSESPKRSPFKGQTQQSATNGDPPIGPGRQGDPSPILGGKKEPPGPQEVGLQESESSNSDSYKSIQERFADMIQSVGTFHELQNQKIEEVKQSFMSALSATPVAKNSSATPTQELADTPLHENTRKSAKSELPEGFQQKVACSTQSAVESFEEENEVRKQDELYRQLMSAPSGEHVEAAANLIRERSSGNSVSTKSPTKSVEYFQSKRVFQRAETQKLMSQPQFMAEAARHETMQPSPQKYEDDPSLAEVMNLNPSTSSDGNENIYTYWEVAKKNQAQATQDLIARTQIGTARPLLSQQKEEVQPQHPRISPYISTEPADIHQALDEPPAIGRGSSIAENTRGDGTMFSIESEDEDESLLQDSLLQEHATTQKSPGPRLYDGPVPSAKSSFSMARSRQLSLVDSASTEEDMSLATNDYNPGNQDPGHNQDEQQQIEYLLDRLETVEKRKYNNDNEYHDAEDQTVEDEISEIKSILQGLKIQNQRRTSHDEVEEHQIQDNHSLNESAASSGYGKSHLRSPNGPTQGHQMATLRTGDESVSRRPAAYRTSRGQSFLKKIPNYRSGGQHSIQDRQLHTAPQYHSTPHADFNNPPEPQQQFMDEPYEQFMDEPYEQGIEWPDDGMHHLPVVNGVDHNHVSEHNHISYYGHDVNPNDHFQHQEPRDPTYHYQQDNLESHSNFYSNQMEAQGHVVYSAPPQNDRAVMPHQTDDEFFYSRTESDITTSIALDPSLTREPNAGSRQCKSHRAATYFDTLSAGVKANGSFDSVSADRHSWSTSSKKTTGSSTGSKGHTKNSEESTTADTLSQRRSTGAKKKVEFKNEPKKTDPGIKDRIFRNAKDQIERLERNGDISERNKARVLRFMDPLVGNSSDEESTRSQEEEDDDEPHTLKSYLPACHFFCG